MALGYDIALLLRSDPDWAADRGEVQFLDRRTDGVIFASPVIGETDKTYLALSRHNIPTVVCYRRDLPDGIAWVDPDNKEAMYAAVSHLVENGHTQIAYATTGANANNFDMVERRQYFLEALRSHGLDCGDERIYELHYFATTPDQIQGIIDAGYTALVCINDLLAIGVMNVMRDAGMLVPDALSIVGMDGDKAAENGLTSVEFSIFDIGYKAVEAIVEVIGGRSAEESCRVVPVRLVPRDTVKRLK
jgi:DNA-binding LacI/PurR family transcriptional regulator